MSKQAVEGLIKEGRIERIRPDPVGARAMLEESKKHLQSASLIIKVDANGAYALLYDGARKAVSAHMLAAGFRPMRNRVGAHAAVVDYAEAVINDDAFQENVRSLDRMRRNRNRSEYGNAIFGTADVIADLAHARKIVEAVEAGWPTKAP